MLDFPLSSYHDQMLDLLKSHSLRQVTSNPIKAHIPRYKIPITQNNWSMDIILESDAEVILKNKFEFTFNEDFPLSLETHPSGLTKIFTEAIIEVNHDLYWQFYTKHHHPLFHYRQWGIESLEELNYSIEASKRHFQSSINTFSQTDIEKISAKIMELST